MFYTQNDFQLRRK